MMDVFSILSSALPRGALVVGFHGSEGLSRPYVFEIYVALDAALLDLESGPGARATLTLDRQDGRPPFVFNGVLAELSLLHELDGRALVRVVMVPALAFLRQTFHSRLFTDQSIPDILREVLEQNGIGGDDVALRLSRAYPTESHVCQYQESDFDFISRWMEHEGIYYYFEQGDGRERLVLTDDRAVHEDLLAEPVRFFAGAGTNRWGGERLETFAQVQRALPARVEVDDYDYAKPSLPVVGRAPVSSTGAGTMRTHGARFFTPAKANSLASVRSEELLARQVVFEGGGTRFYLRPGYTFTLEEHPILDGSYLVTDVEHHGNQRLSLPDVQKLVSVFGLDVDELYRAEVKAISRDVQFRAEEKTPWPRVHGTEHGTVDGPADSEYAQIDDQGRYLVRFSFDESSLPAGKASTWVRMAQPHGGGIEGFHFPLRKGTEVVFTFLGGDPDRPVIAGVVPSALTPSPVTSGNHTTNVLQTGGRNRFELEDRAGQERITLSTPYSNSYLRMGAPNFHHHMIIHTWGPTHMEAGQSLTIKAGGTKTEDIKGLVDQAFHDGQWTSIQSGRTETITGGGSYDEIQGGAKWFIHGNVEQHVHSGTWAQRVDSGNVTHTYKAEFTQHVTSGVVTATYGDTLTQTVTGTVTQQSRTDAYSLWADAGGVTLTSNGKPFTINAPKGMAITAPSVTINSQEVGVKIGAWKGNTGNALEFYKWKWLVGISKDDVSAFSLSIPAIDLKGGGIVLGMSGAKIDFTGFKFEANGIKKDLKAVSLKQVLANLKTAGIGIISAGLRVFK